MVNECLSIRLNEPLYILFIGFLVLNKVSGSLKSTSWDCKVQWPKLTKLQAMTSWVSQVYFAHFNTTDNSMNNVRLLLLNFCALQHDFRFKTIIFTRCNWWRLFRTPKHAWTFCSLNCCYLYYVYWDTKQYTLIRSIECCYFILSVYLQLSIRQRSDYIKGFDTAAIGPNKSRKLTRLIVPAHNIRSKFWIKKHAWLYRQTVIFCEAMYVVFHTNFATCIVCRQD